MGPHTSHKQGLNGLIRVATVVQILWQKKSNWTYGQILASSGS